MKNVCSALMLTVFSILIGCAGVNLRDETQGSFFNSVHPYTFKVFVGDGAGDVYPDTIKTFVHLGGIWHEMSRFMPGTGYGTYYYPASAIPCENPLPYAFKADYTRRNSTTVQPPELLSASEIGPRSVPYFGRFDWWNQKRSNGSLTYEIWYLPGDPGAARTITVYLLQLIPGQTINVPQISVVPDQYDPDPGQWQIVTAMPVSLNCGAAFPVEIRYSKSPPRRDDDNASVLVYTEVGGQPQLAMTIPVSISVRENPP